MVHLCLKIAGCAFRFQLEYPCGAEIPTGQRFGNYQFSPDGLNFDGEYRVRSELVPVEMPPEELIFREQGFCIRQDPGTGAIRMASYCLQLAGWQLVADLSADFSSGTLYLRHEIDGTFHENPLHYPMRDHLLHNRFAALGVVICHGSHVDYDGRSLIFIAKSGTGKTTTGLLWEDAGYRLLNDEKNLLFIQDGVARASTSFWHGSYPVTTPGENPLAAIFLLQQAPENRLVRVPALRTVSRLLANTFSERYHKENFQKVIDTYSALVERVPVYEFHCTPDQRAVDLVKRELALPPSG